MPEDQSQVPTASDDGAALRERPEDLRERMARGGTLSPAEVVAWLGDVARELDALHRLRIAHGHVRPESVLFGDDGGATLRPAADATPDLLRASVYAAPEAGDGESAGISSPSAASDQYALAVVAYEALCAALPHEGATEAERHESKRTRPPLDLVERASEVSELSWAALRRALARDPEDRFPSCAALADAFAEGVVHRAVGVPFGRRAAPSAASEAAGSGAVAVAATARADGGLDAWPSTATDATSRGAGPVAARPSRSRVSAATRSKRGPVLVAAGVGAGVVLAVVVGLVLLRSRPTERADAPPSVGSRVTTPEGIAQFLEGWAEPASLDADKATGFPTRIRRLRDRAEMVLVPPGSFPMGAADGDESAAKDERPARLVTISRTVYFDEHEVTVRQFDRFATATKHESTAEREGTGWIVDSDGQPVERRKAYWGAATPDGETVTEAGEQPVVLVSWNDAKAFASWAGARLPSEAEFERLLRRGVVGRSPWGDGPPPSGAGNFADAAAKKRFPTWVVVDGCDDGFARTAPVKRFQPDAFGLYDVSGNVSEWCEDGYDAAWYARGPSSDPVGPMDAPLRVVRGGSWFSTLADLRCSRRAAAPPTYRSADVGFRCCISVR